jgi:hypothetical protein
MIYCSAFFYEELKAIVDPWYRELRRARRQLARIGA